MKSESSMAAYLDQATAGLHGDAELQREVRAELAAHVEDAREALVASGRSEEAATRESVEGMGDVLEASALLQNANLGRMRWRGRIRIGLQYGLAPLAVVVALAVSNHLSNGSLRQYSDFMGSGPLAIINHRAPAAPADPSFMDEEHLILYGDPAREGPGGSQRTLWERNPTNRVYLGNYITALIAEMPGADSNAVADALSSLEAASEVEPENARYDLLQGGLRLAQSVTLEQIAEDEEDGPLSHRLTIHDPAGYDAAVEKIRAGLSKPYLKRYTQEMLRRQHDVLGPSQRFADWVQRTSVSSAILLPDLQTYISTTQILAARGRELLQAGEPEEARWCLDAWEPLLWHFSCDSFILLDVLVFATIAESAREGVAGVYEEAGLAEDAQRTREHAGRVGRGIQAWRASLKDETAEKQAMEASGLKYGALLSRVLLPAIGEWPLPEQYDASRRLEYTVATELVVVLASNLLVAMLIGCALVAFRWRLGSTSAAAIPILLLPRPGRLMGMMAYGILLPFAVFMLITRLVPWSGHAYSMYFGGHKLIAEFGLLIASWIFLPAWLTMRAVRERCETLGLPTARMILRRLRWPAGASAAGLAVVWLVPATESSLLPVVAFALAGALGLTAVIAGVLALAQGFGGDAAYGLFYGTLSRSMIPNLAAAVMLLSVSGASLLVRSECAYLARDTLLYDPGGGFTAVETRLTNRLLEDVRAGFASFESRPSPPGED